MHDGTVGDGIIYLEKLPPYILGSWLKSHLQIIILHNIFRLGIIALVVCSVPLLINGNEDVLRVFIPLASLSILLCLIWSEWCTRDHRRSSVPIKVYSDRILLYSFIYEKILGYNGSIHKDEIERIEIKRGALTQNVGTRRTFFWQDAPVGFYVILHNGKKRYSGLRNPSRVMAITKLLRDEWNVPVIDKGEGWGTVTKFFNGKEYQ